MFILEEPYVSPLLRDEVLRSGAPVLETPIAVETLAGSGIQFTPPQRFAALAAEPGARLYSNSENAIGWIDEHLGATEIPARIALLKDKTAFRKLLAPHYPDFSFSEVSFDQLDAVDPTQLPKPFIIKPAVGFFSIGVHVVDSDAAWPAVRAALHAEVARSRELYPAQVVGLDRFIIEAAIIGEEYAVDAYYDHEGRPVIIDIMHHPFASGDDVSDRVYYTSPEIIEHWHAPVEAFLAELGQLAGLRDFPVHAELRVDATGRITPIEVNPMRFAGWCATDMAWHAWGVSPYACYLNDTAPDWSKLLRTRKGQACGLVIADFPGSLDRSSIASVDYDAFLARFTKPLELRRMDFTRHPVFAFLFTAVPHNDLSELQDVLHADLMPYLRLR